jgi:hypothetical protein
MLTRACLVLALIPGSPLANGFLPLEQRLSHLLDELDPDLAFDNASGLQFAGARVQISDCGNYPYNRPTAHAEKQLAAHLRAGLQQGIQCMIGRGPAGRLHSFHEYQAHRLLDILESARTKTFRCVADRMFANAVATTEQLPPRKDSLYGLLRETRHPGVVLDTFRIGGLLSTRHSPATYHNFFKLNDEQIREHLTGSPLRLGGTHRYRDLPALLFHEMVHWLGHEHSAIQPDMAHLYETCCFGGSDYIEDPQQNASFQARACQALKDDDLWSNAYKPYRQMRLWHYKEYDQLKLEMRANYH